MGSIAASFDYGLNAAATEYDGKNKYLRITDIDDATHEFLKSDLTTPLADLAISADYLLEEGDLLFARTGASVGKTYLYRQYDGTVYFAGFLIRARIEESADPEFVYQATLTDAYKKYVAITSQRSGQPGVNAQEYADYQLMLPSRTEQQQIGMTLRSLDNLITLHQRKCRYRGLCGYLSWEQRKLGEVAHRVIRKNEGNQSDLPLTISAQHGLVDQRDYFNSQVASRDMSGYYLLENGEFAYNKSTSADSPWGAIKRLTKYEKGCLSTLYICFRLDQGDPEFLVTYYETNRWHGAVQMIAAEGARNHGLLNIAPDDFFETALTLPCSTEEQRQIGCFFTQLNSLIALHQHEPRFADTG